MFATNNQFGKVKSKKKNPKIISIHLKTITRKIIQQTCICLALFVLYLSDFQMLFPFPDTPITFPSQFPSPSD